MSRAGIDKQKLTRDLKLMACSPKGKLLDIVRAMEPVNKKQADSLSRIIARLEDWQNR